MKTYEQLNDEFKKEMSLVNFYEELMDDSNDKFNKAYYEKKYTKHLLKCEAILEIMEAII